MYELLFMHAFLLEILSFSVFIVNVQGVAYAKKRTKKE